MAIDETISIAAPPELVWSLLDDPQELPSWMPDVVETLYPDGRRKSGAVGTQFVQKVRDGGRIKEYRGLVTAFEAGRLLGIELVDGTYRIAVSYRLSPEGAGTRLAYTGALTMRNPLFQMMAAMAWPVTRTILLRQAMSLKAAAEARTLATPPPSAPRKAKLARKSPVKRKAIAAPKKSKR